MTTCSICLNPVRKTRQSKELQCGHLYHAKCIDQWSQETCPLCRQHTGTNQFRITLTIENLKTTEADTLEVSAERIQEILGRMGLELNDMNMIASSDVVFDAADLEDLESALSDFGVSLSDVNSSVLNTE
jgi:hypothetical protein